MEDSHVSNTSWNETVDENRDLYAQVKTLVNWIIISVGLLLTLLAILAVLLMVKKHRGAPVYILNLLMSDLIQLCSRIPIALHGSDVFSYFALRLGLIASVGFMVCVSMERYLLIAKPLWYRCRQNIWTSVLICVTVWILSFVLILVFDLTVRKQVVDTILGVFLLLPVPLFVFFLAGTIKALSEAQSVAAEEKRRIVSALVVVLLGYVLLFLPVMIHLLLKGDKENVTFQRVVFFCFLCSPLVDLILFILLRKSAVDRFLASLCCCKMSKSSKISSSDSDNISAAERYISTSNT